MTPFHRLGPLILVVEARYHTFSNIENIYLMNYSLRVLLIKNVLGKENNLSFWAKIKFLVKCYLKVLGILKSNNEALQLPTI
jgi:hypothetical protein